MVVDVEVVVGRLPDPVEGVELGQDGAGRAELAEQLDPAQRVGAADEQPQLGELALAGGLAGPRRGGAGDRRRRRLDLEPELSGDPGGAQDPQRIVLEAALRDGAEDPGLEVAEPAAPDRSARPPPAARRAGSRSR